MIYRSKGMRHCRAGAAVAAAAALVAGVLVGAAPAQAAPTSWTPAPCNSLTARQVAADVPYARCFAVSPTDPSTGKKAKAAAAPPDYALTPADIQDAYKLPDAGAGMTVAIVDAFGYDNAESDLAVFRSFYGLAPCTSAGGCFTKIDQRGGSDYPDEDGGWSIETALDLDAVSSACPKCKILLVQADSNDAVDLAEAVGTAAARNPAAISNSYGVDGEFPGEDTLDTYYDHPGIAVTVSTGDTGNVQSYPATSPVVTAVGGTELIKDDSARGWNEVAWDSGGSGCSIYEAKPDFQQSLKSGCDSRVTADISADAATPIGVYNTLGQSGWAAWGGTSLSSPLTAAMYALAGAPTPGTYPATYPYLNAGQLYDVTQGTNGTCGNVLCQAGAGWDGPTGLGTPVGLSALTLGDSGSVGGAVTSGGTGVAGAAVVATSGTGDKFTATTGSDGSYVLNAPVGTYNLAVTKFGYSAGSAGGVVIAKGAPAKQDFTLDALPTRTISGHVTDGSGHGWPMRAKITVDGYPGGAIYSDAFTGHYSVSLPTGSAYKLHVTSADLPGYVDQDLSVPLSANTQRDISLAADTTACNAPGYAFQEEGLTEAFTGWTGATPKDGWTVTDAAGNGQTWRFENMGGWDPPPGGDASFADVDSDVYGQGGKQDTSLVSPVIDLSGRTDPEIGFDTTYIGFPGQTGYVDLSLDGGTTWSTVRTLDGGVVDHVDIGVPQASGHNQARVRFRFVGDWSRRWEIDDVVVGARYCAAQPGGLVAGHVTDANTGDVLSGATVVADGAPATLGATDADGYYWLYSSHLGKTAFTVTDGRYAAGHPIVNVPADSVREADVALDAGHVTVSPTALTSSMTLGASASQTFTLGNDGKVPVHVHLGESDAGVAPAAGKGAPAMRVKASTSIASMPAAPAAAPATAKPSISPWTDISNYALPVMDNTTAAHNGTVYVAGGNDGINKLSVAGYYDAAAGGWHQLPDLPEELSAAAGSFIDDTFYVVGGWNEQGNASVHAYALKDGATTWRKVADLPSGVAAAGTAVVAGKLYVVGGCTTGACLPVSAGVVSYDPGADKWTREPDYPAAAGYLACGSAASAVICAGGNSGNGSLTKTYAYVPGSGAWKSRADLPADTWGAASASANGRFEVIGGAVGGGSAITNQGWEYDPSTDSWAALPNANNATYRGGAACGIFQVGGSTGGFNPTAAAALLPGYGDCGGDVPWLSLNATDVTVAPGKTVKVRVTADSSQVAQPGVYSGLVTVSTDTPYPTAAPISVTMTATPPAAWGKIEGTVLSSSGQPIAGATVAVCTMYDTRTGACGPTTFTLKADAGGHYQLWLNKGYNPLQVIAAKDGYTPLLKLVKVQKGETVTTDFTLTANASFSVAKLNQYLAGALKKR